MKVRHIFKHTGICVFVVVNPDYEDTLDWEIEPTNNNLIPEADGIYFVKAIQVLVGDTNCFLQVDIPKRIAETVITDDAHGVVSAKNIYEINTTVIPAIASECFGNYELYYAPDDPQKGIDILKKGVAEAENKSAIAEDLGYILRDEGRIEDAIEAFKLSEQYGPSSEYIFSEIANLYQELGMQGMHLAYQKKFKQRN